MAARLRWRNNSKDLTPRQVIIGRTRANQANTTDWLLLTDDRVSERHASIHLDANSHRYIITDLNSVNGTFIRRRNPNNGTYESETRLRTPYPLHPGDQIRIGQTVLRYEEFQPTAQAGNGGGGGWLIGLIIVILIIAGAANSSQNNSPSTPDKTLSSYCDALNNNDYQAAYNQLSSTVKAKETEVQFASKLQQSFDHEGGLSVCTVGSTQEQGTTATGTLTYAFTQGPSVMHTEQLIKENDTWKINSQNP